MYVRSLARDIGLALETAAHLGELRRVRNGAFLIERARALAEVVAALEQGEEAGLIDLRTALAALPEVQIEPALEQRLRHGDSRALDALAPPGAKLFKVIAHGDLVAIAEATSRVTASIARIFGAN
jgi:tRNA U55 pseudouridine synthase TruB